MSVQDELTAYSDKQLVTIPLPRDVLAETYDVIF